MANVEKYADGLMQLSEDMKALKKKVNFYASPGDFMFGMDEIVKTIRSMFDRFCPFKVGSRVELTRTPEIGDNSGWRGCKHFLIEGAAATVRERGYRDGKFTCDLMFDDETWIDRDGGKHQPREKHVFMFDESWVRVLPDNASANRPQRSGGPS